MIAATANQLAGNKERAEGWTAEVRRRAPDITTSDFFKAFPFRNLRQRERMANALTELGFQQES
jgi:hypothetical protein